MKRLIKKEDEKDLHKLIIDTSWIIHNFYKEAFGEQQSEFLKIILNHLAGFIEACLKNVKSKAVWPSLEPPSETVEKLKTEMKNERRYNEFLTRSILNIIKLPTEKDPAKLLTRIEKALEKALNKY